MIGLDEPVAVVAHDAGAANIILAWLEGPDLTPCRPAMEGPAARLWEARFPHTPLLPLDTALSDAATLLSGTGWASTFEHEARRSARNNAIRSVAVIDHWVNYRERFVRAGVEVLPDEIWVTDEYGLEEARRAIPEVPARQKPNLYAAQQAAAAGPVPEHGDLLFVSEPARSDWDRDLPGEFQTLDYLDAFGAAAAIDAVARIRIRPHPSEVPGKYDAWVAAHPGSSIDRSPNLAAALVSARWVAGLQSAAMVIANQAGRQVICALPPHAPPCVLPHREIIHLRDLASGTAAPASISKF